MHRQIVIALVAAVVLGFGCIDYAEQLQLNKDGSGRISMKMAVDDENYQLMKEMAEAFGETGSAPMDGVDESRIRAVLKERNSKAKLEKYAESTRGGDRVWEMAFTFTGGDDLADIGAALDEDGDPSAPFTYEKQPDGTWLYRRDLEMDEDEASVVVDMKADELGLPAGIGEGFDPENFDTEEFAKNMEKQMEQLQKMAQKMESMEPRLEERKASIEEDSKNRSVRFAVTFPGEVIESNATKVEGKTAVWEYTLVDMQAMEGKMPALTARVKH